MEDFSPGPDPEMRFKGSKNVTRVPAKPRPFTRRSQSASQLPVNAQEKYRSTSLTSDVLGRRSPQHYRRTSSDSNVVKEVVPSSQLVPRTNTLHVVWEKEKQDLKSKLSELEDFKTKYEAEKKENERLQDRMNQLLASQNDTGKKLNQSLESVDKLRTDLKKKTEQLEKFQRDLSYKDDRIRNLEIRASEVEKAELILETTKQTLESTNHQVRVRDTEIRKLTKEGDDLNRSLDLANQTIKDMEVKVDDLKFQVRQELMKNDNIEKNLETIPRLKETIEENEEEIRDLQQQLREKTALLTASRRTLGEYKEKLRNTESEIAQTERLKADLRDCQCEIHTLKKLMSGKDYLVVQKSKALDLSKELIEVLNDSPDHNQVERVQHLIERLDEGPYLHSRSLPSRNGTLSSASEPEFRSLSAPPPKQNTKSSRVYALHNVPLKDIDINDHPYPSENGHHGNQDSSNSNQKHIFLNKVIIDTPSNRKRPISALGHSASKKSSSSIHKTSSLREAQKVYRLPQPRKNNAFEDITVIKKDKDKGHAYKSDTKVNSKLKPSLEYPIGLEDNQVENQSPNISPRGSTPAPGSHRHRILSVSDSDSSLSDLSDDEDLLIEQESAIRSLSAKEKDTLLCDIISVGDRVLISCPQKQPKYGKKKVLKPINHTGIVKFRGKLDPDKYDARVFVGVRMDDTAGDTDGTYKGKRFMYTPYDQGKFFKLRDVTSVLDVKSGRYILVKRLLLRILQKRKVTLPGSQEQKTSH